MPKRVYPSFFQAFLLVILIVLLQLLMSFVIGFMSWGSAQRLVDQITPGLANLFAFGVAIFIGVKKSSFAFSQRLRTVTFEIPLILALVFIVIGLHIILSEIDNLFQVFFPMPKQIADFFFHMITDSHIATAVVTLIIIAPVTEEIFFRGIIFEGFLGNYSSAKSMFLSSLLFALLHLNPWQMPHAFVLGVFFAYLYQKTRSLPLCILGHALNNAIPLLITRIIAAEIEGYSPEAYLHPTFQPLWLDLLAVLFLVLGLYFSFVALKHDEND